MALRRGGSPAAAKAAKIEKKAAKAADKAERKARRAAEQAGDSVSRAAGTALAAVEAVTSDKPGRKAAKKARKEAGKAQKALSKEAGTAAPKDLTPAHTKRLIAVGKAVAPLLAPYAIAAGAVARDRWDAHRARQLGVSADQLGRYSGRGGALHARISRAGEALTELENSPDATAAATSFVREMRPRLADLAVAVRAAEQMPSARRRTAFRAVAGELDRIEDQLLDLLGIRP
ncbi:hypothetical protein GCM10010472_27270 [Pseudonocardia halophobica]|uniref:Uncharacterized protein n=1 Tax=Pseudonocardia halophobica TaxID=29401 RepID=A0A9W6KVV9_9PSEU|nr:DUF6474 family protein [Pseudonocardia halophobica]GLL08986.1 hypothetical protein GCM10017577_01260 [Pseudonocardia halophobica]